MIKVTENVSNIIKYIENDIINFETEYHTKVALLIEEASKYIENELAKLYPESDHFKAEAEFLAGGMFKLCLYVDDVGGYIYYGTAPHVISAVNGNSLTIGNTGDFASFVNHPGTASRKDEIDAIVVRAIEVMQLGVSGWAL